MDDSNRPERTISPEPPVVVITGASRGLGAGIAAELADRGFRLGLCARTEPDPPPGADTARIITAAVDVTDAPAVDAFGERVATDLGPISIWINNAGLLGPIAPARSADPEEVRDAVLVNVLGVFNGSAAFARLSRRRPGPEPILVNISSGAASSVYPGWSTYGPTKAAVEHLGRHVAAEEPGLRVVSLAPGVVDTDMQTAIRAADEGDFPAVDRFRRLREDDAYNRPGWIADRIIALWDRTWVPDHDVVRVPDEPGAPGRG